ncbi:MAG: formyltransferase family protein [Pseudomonadota bacterium]
MTSATGGPKILVLTGAGNPARAAANIYAQAFAQPDCEVQFIENTLSPKFVLRFFLRRLRRRGILDTLGTFLLRLRFSRVAPIPKQYAVTDTVSDLDHLDREAIARYRPDVVIANACSLLSADCIAFFHGLGAEIINVHNGLNPRYRGTGNTWAFFERNFALTGTTLHHIDAGVDTGETISAQPIDFVGNRVPYELTDIEAFKAGAHMAVEYVTTGVLGNNTIDVPTLTSRSRAYTYPAWSEYRRSKERYLAALAAQTPASNEDNWKQSFKDLARETDRDVFQRQHWGDSSTVSGRDELTRDLAEKYGVGHTVLDIGCGDGRYRHFWPAAEYWGCDYSLETLLLGGELQSVKTVDSRVLKANAQALSDEAGHFFLEASAGHLPLENATVSCILGIGLLQHLDNTGALADDALRVLGPGGLMILNTLRQPSKFELLPMLALGLVKSSYWELTRAVWREDYFSNLTIDGTKLARRYAEAELRDLFAPHATVLEVRYGGILGTRFMSREIAVVFRKQ